MRVWVNFIIKRRWFLKPLLCSIVIILTQITGTVAAQSYGERPLFKSDANNIEPNVGGLVIPTIFLLLLDEEELDMGDNDNDRLLNYQETNTGIYISAEDTGTDPNVADTDGDSINDGDEVLGTLEGLDLPAMGVSPLRKNILLEYDWFDDNLDSGTCSAHSHRPTEEMIARFASAFENATLSNPDGSFGITTINDYGQGGVFSGGNLIDDADGVLTGGVNSAEFQNHKIANFNSNRNGYFHYVLLPHRYNTSSGSSGQAELPGDDSIVSLQCFSGVVNTSNTIMHELGHNLDLRHGGDSNCNYKPNYNSVMNYRYQFPGVDTNCNVAGDGVLDYSRDNNRDLNENALNETLGICNSPVSAFDWNNNAMIESNVVFDINSADSAQVSNCGGTRTILTDHNDWGNMLFTGLSDGDGQNLIPYEIIDCDNPVPSI